MAFFDDHQLDALQIDRMVFHLVGPQANDVVRLEEIDPGHFTDFFLGRIRSINSGVAYQFSDASATRERLARIAADPTQFQLESERLTDDFQRFHGGTTARGAFLIFVLSVAGEQSFALLKYDDETVLRYELLEGRGGRKRVELEALERTFVQNPDALQKSALVRLTPEGGDLVVMDRQNQPNVARYFENFLDAVRVYEDAELTEKLVQVTRQVIRANRDLVPVEAYSRMTQRTFDAASAGGVVSPDQPESFLEAVLGQPLPQDHSLILKFLSGLKRARIDGTPIALDPALVTQPTTLRLVTVNNIHVSVPLNVRGLVVIEPHRIIINDDIERRYDDTDGTR